MSDEPRWNERDLRVVLADQGFVAHGALPTAGWFGDSPELARELGEDPDVLLAMAGKVSSDLQEIIRKRPELFAELIRQLKKAPDHAVLKVVREVRDGDW